MSAAVMNDELRPWRLINMKVPVEVLERIDAEAKRLRLTRTAYMVWRSDPRE